MTEVMQIPVAGG